MEGADVIAAVATGAGPAAVAIVRLSGPGSWALVRRLLRDGAADPAPRTLAPRWLRDPRTGRALDHAMVALFPAGASYTGEESAELHCHGGPALVDRVLDACLAAGARPARPGEFTRRAVAAGRLDLLQAEAVALLAAAGTGTALEAGLQALSGRPSAEVVAARETALDALAEVEAALDHDASDGVVADLDAVDAALADLSTRMRAWVAAARALRPALAGARVVLAGSPNAGKSSLFNALLGQDRAIVHPRPGTTRDPVGEVTALGGAPVLLTDTAGLRDAGAGEVEAEGVARARQAAREADLVVWVVDGTGAVPPGEAPPRVDLLALTKADLGDPVAPPPVPAGVPVVATSARDGRGVDALREELARRAAALVRAGEGVGGVVLGDRQAGALRDALAAVDEAAAGRAGGAPLEAVAAALRRSVEHLGELDGTRVTEAVLDRIFARFCVGK